MTQVLDAILRRAVETGAVPGVVAMLVDARGILYEGAAGNRDLAIGAPMRRDTVFPLASATKPLTATAALQLVDAGRLDLDEPVAERLPGLAAPSVLTGFAGDGTPLLRPARTPISLRHLLTHTSGFGYALWNADLDRYARHAGVPAPGSGRLAFLELPLLFEPGTDWHYGIGLDWVGRLVEAASDLDLATYLDRHVHGPLQMHDSGFLPGPAQAGRVAAAHQRRADGVIEPVPAAPPPTDREFFTGGGGSYASVPDFARFLRMLLNGGGLDGARLLSRASLDGLLTDQLGAVRVRPVASTVPARSRDIDPFPGASTGWSLGFCVNGEALSGRRRVGSLSWAGIANTHFWLDPAEGIAGLFFTQLLPFLDPPAMAAFAEFERASYAARAAGAL